MAQPAGEGAGVGQTLNDEDMLAWMSREPALIRRPIVVADGRRLVQPKATALAGLGGPSP